MKLITKNQHLRPTLAISLMLGTILNGCSDDAITGPSVPKPEDRYGIWERTGYGDVAEVDATGAQIYQYTRQGCLYVGPLNNAEFAELFDPLALSDDGQRLITAAENQVDFAMHLDRLPALPVACQADNLITQATPTATFEHLWHTFNDHYAFFEERGVDWASSYAEIRPLVSDDMDDEALLEVFAALLEPLDDGHVQLTALGDEFDFTQLRGANQAVSEGFNELPEFATEAQREQALQDYVNRITESFVQIRSSYLDDGSQKSTGGPLDTRVTWGTINNQIGYLRIARMTDLSTTVDNSVTAQLQAINSIMQTALPDLQNTTALIIDVRVNKGGEDAVSLAIANYFTDEKRLVLTRSSRTHAGETAEVEAYISPATQTPYLQPIAVIAAEDTSSAAEIFLMAMNALPNVTLVGENSNGILSNTLSKTLPNGWEIFLSNEVFRDHLGMNHEVTGVPVDVRAATFSIEAIEQNKDPAIEAAITTLGF